MLFNQQSSRIKLNVGMLTGGIAIVLFGIAILSRKTDPQSSSFAFVSALLILFGMIANFAVPKIRSFLHHRGYQPNSLYTDCSSAIGYTDGGTGMDGGISCNFGDGGGCDGGG
jgi:hypothetical protein